MDENVVFEENIYYDQTEAPDIFDVTIVENIAAERCQMKGVYELHITSENFALVDKKSNKRLHTWPFRHVRRYGKSSTNFQFEAGRKCSSGEGLFSLLTKGDESEKIFKLIQTRFDSMKTRDKRLRSTSIEEQTPVSPTGNPPNLAARQYENNPVPRPPPKIAQPVPNSKARQSSKPPIKAKPKSIKIPTVPPTTNRPPAESAGHNASAINSLIGQNKDLLTLGVHDEENTYSVMGQGHEEEGAAQYSEVYTKPSVPTYTVGDDTYDEVKM